LHEALLIITIKNTSLEANNGALFQLFEYLFFVVSSPHRFSKWRSVRGNSKEITADNQ